MEFRTAVILLVTAIPLLVVTCLYYEHLADASKLQKCKEDSCIRYCCKRCSHEDEEKIKTFLRENLTFSEPYTPLKGQLCSNVFQEENYTMAKNGEVILIENGVESRYDSNSYCIETEKTESGLVEVHFCFEDSFADKIRDTYPYFMMCSMPFLIVTLVIYGYVRELRNIHGKCLMSYVGSLMIVYILLLVQTFNNGNFGKAACTFIGYALLTSIFWCFSWLSVMCFDIWVTFKRGMKAETLGIYLKYAACAFIIPLVCTLIVFILHHFDVIPEDYKHNIGMNTCNVSHIEDHLHPNSPHHSKKLQAIYLYLPIILFLVVNMTFYGITAWKIHSVQRETKFIRKGAESQRHVDKSIEKMRFFLYLRLSVIMGLPWIIESLSFYFDDSPLLLIASFINCMQGFIIFVTFVWSQKVEKLLIRKLTLKRQSAQMNRNMIYMDERSTEKTRLNSLRSQKRTSA